jgi:hypothetical protein
MIHQFIEQTKYALLSSSTWEVIGGMDDYKTRSLLTPERPFFRNYALHAIFFTLTSLEGSVVFISSMEMVITTFSSHTVFMNMQY